MRRILAFYFKISKWSMDIFNMEERLKDAAAGTADFVLTKSEAATILERGQPIFRRARKTLNRLG